MGRNISKGERRRIPKGKEIPVSVVIEPSGDGTGGMLPIHPTSMR